uniref:Small ribosomal subunit protein uS5 C-terminal domain-containing protein n=1 Tax=Kalanchoe fedtschenkoi TaxID=63787 RepID=A0A7N0TZN3_KALFE
MTSKSRAAVALSRLLLRKAVNEPSIGAISRRFSTMPHHCVKQKEEIHASGSRVDFGARWFLSVRAVTSDAFSTRQEAVSESESEESDEDDEDEERLTREAVKNKLEFFKKKFRRHEELLKSFVKAETLDDAYKCMKRIDKFEAKHFRVRPEYRVMGELMSRLKTAEGKEKFVLQQKLHRAVRLAEVRELNDPTNVENLGKLETRPMADNQLEDEEEKDKDGDEDYSDKEDEDDMYEGDHVLIEKLNAIDQKLEEKLADLAHTFGKKGKLLEEEIKELAEERNALSEKKSRPVFRKGFDVQLLNVNRTVKVTKVYLWPRPTYRGVAAGRHVNPILQLTGLKNVHSKVIGSRNPFNQVKAVFKALNAMETPKDMQEKLGRSVVESYLL